MKQPPSDPCPLPANLESDLALSMGLPPGELASKVLAAAPVGIWLLDQQGRTTFANPRLAAMLRTTRERMRGRAVLDCTRPERRAQVHALLRRSKVETTADLDALFLREDGTDLSARVTCSQLRGDGGGHRGWLLLLADLTENLQAEAALRESEERFRAVADYTVNWESWLDERGKLLWVNPGVERVTGYRVDECLHMPDYPLPVIHPDDRGFIAENLERARRGESGQELEFRIVRKDATVGWASVSWQRVLDRQGRSRGHRSSVRDITARKAAEQALREAEWSWRQIFDAVNDMVFVHDARTGAILSVNRRFCEAYGYTAEEARSLTVADLSPPAPGYSHAEALERIHAATDRGEPQLFEWQARRKDGSTFWEEVSLRPAVLCGEQRVVAVVRDITERRNAALALRASEALFRTAFEDAGVGMALFSFEGQVLRANAALCRLLGYREAELRGRSFRDITWPEDLPASIEAHRRLRSGRSRTETLEKRYRRRDGTVVWCTTSLASTRGNPDAGVALVAQIQDVSERRRLQEEQAEGAQRKDLFLATLGHELRNPLSPLRNAVYLLQRTGAADERTRQAYAMLDRQVTHLTRIVDDLLDISRITRGKITLRLEPLDLAAVLREVAGDLRPDLEARGLCLDLELGSGPVEVRGDRTRLGQIASNLLGNAAKFTAPGGRVTLWLRTEPARGVAELGVRDTGVGLAPEALGRIFEPFQQIAPDLAHSRSGLGLGLALVKGLAELHGGSVAAASPGPGLGATFTVTLPLTPGAAALAHRGERAPATGDFRHASLRVQIIEDNPDAAQSLRLALQLAGHDVAVASNGSAGLEQARHFRPDAVVCDIGLPGALDGYEVARRMRADPALSGSRLVAVTGYGQEEDRRRARAAGFDAHLAKPADPTVLLSLLERGSLAGG